MHRVVLALLGLCAGLGAQVRLQYRFERLDAARYRVESELRETLTLAGSGPTDGSLETVSELSYQTRETYGREGATLTVQLRVEEVEGSLVSDGVQLLRFSSGDSLASPAEPVAALLGATARYRIDAQGELLHFGAEGFDDAIAEQLRVKWPALPADTVAVGAAWAQRYTLPVPELSGSVEVELSYRLEALEESGPAGPLATITGELRLAASEDAAFNINGSGTVRWTLMLRGGWLVSFESHTVSRMDALGVEQTVEQTTRQSLLELELHPESVD